MVFNYASLAKGIKDFSFADVPAQKALMGQQIGQAEDLEAIYGE